MHAPPSTVDPRLVVPAAVLAVLVLGTSSVLLAPPGGLAAWWPAMGVTVLALVLLGRGRAWGTWWATLLLTTLAAVAANYLGGRSLATASFFGLNHLVEAALVAWIACRGLREAPTLTRPSHLLRLGVGTAVGVTAGATIAAVGLALTTDDPPTQAAVMLLSHPAAILIAVPLAYLRGLEPIDWRSRETALQWAAMLGASAAVFSPGQASPFAFVLFPLLLWGALRIGVRSVAWQLLAIAVLTTTLVALHPVLVDEPDVRALVTLLQAFLVSAALITLPLAVVVDQRRVLGQRMAESEELFRRSFSESLTGMLLLRRTDTRRGQPRLVISELNETAAEILGDTADELLGRDFAEMLDGDVSVPQVVTEMELGLRPGWTHESALLVGERRRVRVMVSLLSGGASDGVFVAQMIDVTAAHLAAQDLRTERDFTTAILGTTASLILVVAVDGLVVGMNEAAQAATGLRETEVVGQPVWNNVVAPEQREEVRSWFTAERGVPTEHEVPLLTRTGARRQVAWTCSYLRDEHGLTTHAVMTGIDVTGERTTRRLVSHLLEAASATSIIGTDLSGRITVFNRGAEELVGYAAEEVLTVATPALFLDPEEIARVGPFELPEVLRRLSEHTDGDFSDWTLVTKGGDRLTVSLTVSLVNDSFGDHIGFLIVGRDVTEQRRQSESLERSLAKEREIVEDMRRLDRAKDDFISTVSHELRTPLTSIVGYTEMMQDGVGGEVDPEQDRLLEIVRRNAERLTTLVEDLLTLSRMESGSFALERTTLDLREVLASAHDSLRPLVDSRGVRVEFALPEQTVPVTGDRLQLERVALNLVGNAVKFTEDGGAVVCRLAVDDPTRAVVEVSDTGIGVPADEIDKLFTRFFRSSNAQERAIQGTGLGLSIVRRIIEAHDGSITVESEEGVGTTFTVELPVTMGAWQGASVGGDLRD
ncbi:MAG: PAS domain S-box protein [Nocardioides sp.]|nr:PAS domain S-box protein [Nocardioides sp.]